MSFNLNWLGTSLSNATLASIIYNVINNLHVEMGIMVHGGPEVRLSMKALHV